MSHAPGAFLCGRCFHGSAEASVAGEEAVRPRLGVPGFFLGDYVAVARQHGWFGQAGVPSRLSAGPGCLV